MATFNYKGYNIYYDVTGSGEPILILNGIMMSTKSWSTFVKPLSKDNMLIRVDFIDQGQSDKAPDLEYDQWIQVSLIKELLILLKISPVNIVGVSYGGEVALKYASKYQEHVRRLVLFNTTAKTSDWLKEIGEGWIKVGKTRDPEAYYKVTIPVIYSSEFYKNNLEWMKNREIALKPVFSNPHFLDAMERLTKSADNHDVRSKLSSIMTTTLVVSADQDYLTPVHEQQFIVDNMPNCKHIIIPKVGHASMYEVPHLFVSLVLGFVNTNEENYPI